MRVETTSSSSSAMASRHADSTPEVTRPSHSAHSLMAPSGDTRLSRRNSSGFSQALARDSAASRVSADTHDSCAPLTMSAASRSYMSAMAYSPRSP